MGADDKTQNNAEKLGGKVQEGLGKATGDKDMEAEGQKDQSKADLKNAGENIKDAFKK
ncbi:CsbD family protein [uncultured Arthrobacter sp.]|uniref:CsbD family protein n=1 Tax=uncultured Arthrobacter sp. TaxID=114050 RepID=UPI002602E86B|nr:CsbD family protein [uncultured Arthrobacter sp.]